MKKFLSVLLSIIFTFSVFSITAYADDFETPTMHMHSYTTEKVVKKATPTANGEKRMYCSCGDYQKKTIYKLSNIYLTTTKYTYDGKSKKPTVKVINSNKIVINTTNYSVSYSTGRVNVGKYSATVKFNSKYYDGAATRSFVINPKSTAISSIIAKSKAFLVKWKKQSAQTTGYQIKYSLKSDMSSSNIVTISKNTTTSKTISGLKASKKYYVQIRTYKTVSGTKYYSSWSAKKTVTTKK